MNHGLYTNTDWQALVSFTTEAGAAIIMSGDYTCDVLQAGVADPLFSFSTADGTITIVSGNLQFTATVAQHQPALAAGIYRAHLRNTSSGPVWQAEGTLVVGAPGDGVTYLTFDSASDGSASATTLVGIKGDQGIQGIQGLQGVAGEMSFAGTKALDVLAGQTIQRALAADFTLPSGGMANIVPGSSPYAGTVAGFPSATITTDAKRVRSRKGLLAATTALTLPGPQFSALRTPLGILCEEAHTNLVFPSQTLNSWNKVACTVADNAAASPDGTVNASTLTQSATGPCHIWKAIAAITSGANHTLQTRFKKGTAPYGVLQFAGATTTAWVAAVFDLTALTVTATAAGAAGAYVSSGILDTQDGWLLAWVTGSVTATSGYVYVGLTDTAIPTFFGFGTASVAANTGMTLSAWGVQLTAGTAITSYVPTTAASAAVIADVVKLPVAGFTLDGTTVGVEFTTPHVFSATAYVWTLYGNGSNLMSLRLDTSGNLIGAAIVGGVSTTIVLGTLAVRTSYRAWLSRDGVLGLLRGALSGASPPADVAHVATPSLVPTSLAIGCNGANNLSQLNGSVAKIFADDRPWNATDGQAWVNAA